MKLPPSPKNQKAAVEFVSSLRNRDRESDFRAIGGSMVSCFTFGTMFLVLSVRNIDVLPWYKIVLSMITLAGGIFFLVIAYRFYGLLQVFDDGRSFDEHLDKTNSTNSEHDVGLKGILP
jgi:hypothetical protein